MGLEGLNCVLSCVIEKMKERDLYHGLFRRLSSYYPIGALTGSKLRNLRCQTKILKGVLLRMVQYTKKIARLSCHDWGEVQGR